MNYGRAMQWSLQKRKRDFFSIMKLAQWIKVHLPMQGTQVQSLVWEDSIGLRAAKSMYHNC